MNSPPLIGNARVRWEVLLHSVDAWVNTSRFGQLSTKMKVFTLKTQLGTMPCSIDLKKSAEDIYLGVGSVTKAATANCCIFRHYTFCKAEWIAAVNTMGGWAVCRHSCSFSRRSFSSCHRRFSSGVKDIVAPHAFLKIPYLRDGQNSHWHLMALHPPIEVPNLRDMLMLYSEFNAADWQHVRRETLHPQSAINLYPSIRMYIVLHLL